MSKKILFLILFSWVVSACSGVFAQQKTDTDTVYTFHFISKKDVFLSSYQGNDSVLQSLYQCVEKHHNAITKGAVPVYVDGYCNTGENFNDCLEIAKIRSNRVKSELITNKGLSESNFITHNHNTSGDYVTVRIVLPEEKTQVVENKQPATENVAPKESVTVKNEKEEVSVVETNTASENVIPQEPVKPETPALSKFSLRTNLLRLATLTPDLGVEWRINKNFGVLLNGTWTSWSWDNKNRRYALWEVSPELRYYIGKDKCGYVGAMYHVGEFNYKFTKTGKQGDIMGGGLTGGYLLRLNNALSLDFSLGVGYTHADYDKYVVIDGVRVRHGSGDKNYWGVNHVGISLVWNIF